MHRPAPQGALGANAAQMAGLEKTPQHTAKEAVPQTLQQAESTLDMLTAKNSKLAERLHQLDDKIVGLEAKWTSKDIDRDTRAKVSAELDAATNKYVQLEKRYDVRQDQINLLKDEIKSLTPPPETRLDKLTARVDRLSPRIDNLLDQIHDLKAEYAQSTHPGDRAEIRAEIQGFEKELAQLDKRDKAARTEINFLTKPKTNVNVKMLMQLAEIQGPRESGGQGDIIRGNLQNLRSNGSLLNKRDELVATQRNVQNALAQGHFNGLPPAELKEMRNLANLNIDTKLDQLADVKQVVNNTSKQLKNMGAGGLFDAGPFGSIPTTAAQRRADAEAERAHIEELAAGGGMNV